MQGVTSEVKGHR